jgi:hypothetical protein
MAEHRHRARLYAYLGLMLTFEGSLAMVARKRAKAARPRLGWSDLVLMGLATHKVSNLISQERVTRVLREPFVEDRKRDGEEEERPAPGPMRGALGELVTCPYCLGPWTALAFAAAHTLMPRQARLITELFATVAISDLLNHSSALLKAKTAESKARKQGLLGEGGMSKSHERRPHRLRCSPMG